MSGLEERPDLAELAELSSAISSCRICVEDPAGTPMPHQPRPVAVLSSTARLAICGQAPGTRVHSSGIPFNDPSGDRLRDWMGVDRETFYDASRLAIVPMGFCFPGLDTKGGDLPPRRECRHAWHDRVFASMPQLELILLIGQYAQAYHLGKARKRTLTETVRGWRDVWNRDVSPRLLPLPHPSWRNSGWLKRNPWFDAEVVPALHAEVARLTAI